jgi:ubiquinone/menaquinone biosynthesis C-methylase UbiE
MDLRKNHICPVAIAGFLDNRVRRWLQDPRKILSPYIKEGMTVLDIGCGPGFFTMDIARMVGRSGRVIAADLQEGMLQRLRKKIRKTDLEGRITLHKCEENGIGLSETVDFITAFYMIHEIPDQAAFLKELRTILNPDGQVFIMEPPFHVSKEAFEETLGKAREFGLDPVEGPRVFFARTVILKK